MISPPIFSVFSANGEPRPKQRIAISFDDGDRESIWYGASPALEAGDQIVRDGIRLCVISADA